MTDARHGHLIDAMYDLKKGADALILICMTYNFSTFDGCVPSGMKIF